jgi:hypothetical protein
MKKIPKHDDHFFESDSDYKKAKDLDAYVALFFVCLMGIFLFCAIKLHYSEENRLKRQFRTFQEYGYLKMVPLETWMKASKEKRTFMIHVTTQAKDW